MSDFIKQQIFPGWYAGFVNKIVLRKYKEQEEYSVNIECIESGYEQVIKSVKNDLEKQATRKERIEEKSKSLLFIIAVTITAITFSLNYISKLLSNDLQIIAISFLLVSILYLVMGSVRALQALNIRMFNVYQVEVEKSDSQYILLKELDDEDLLKDLIKKKQLNDLINTQLSNFTYSSFTLIRNGIVLFMIFFISTIVISYYSHQEKIKDILKLQKEITVKISDEINVVVPYTIDFNYKINNLEILKSSSKKPNKKIQRTD